jgi:hypothetical protein
VRAADRANLLCNLERCPDLPRPFFASSTLGFLHRDRFVYHDATVAPVSALCLVVCLV